MVYFSRNDAFSSLRSLEQTCNSALSPSTQDLVPTTVPCRCWEWPLLCNVVTLVSLCTQSGPLKSNASPLPGDKGTIIVCVLHWTNQVENTPAAVSDSFQSQNTQNSRSRPWYRRSCTIYYAHLTQAKWCHSVRASTPSNIHIHQTSQYHNTLSTFHCPHSTQTRKWTMTRAGGTQLWFGHLETCRKIQRMFIFLIPKSN